MIFSDVSVAGLLALAFIVGTIGALIPAWVAERKGYSGPLFFIFGLFAWPFAMVTAFLVQDKNTDRSSPGDRAEEIERWMLLHDQGAITEEQFQEEKTRILMSP